MSLQGELEGVVGTVLGRSCYFCQRAESVYPKVRLGVVRLRQLERPLCICDECWDDIVATLDFEARA